MTRPRHWVAARSDVGRERLENEDRLVVVDEPAPGCGLVVCVADGMGGHPAGEEAAEITIEHLGRWRDEAPAVLAEGPEVADDSLPALLRLLLEEAHEAVVSLGESDPAKLGMGTTAVALLLRAHQATVIHCGDSRAYLLRGEVLEQLTGDHVIVDGGVRYLAAHLGMAEGLHVDTVSLPIETGDRLLLCSDGLTDMVPPEVFGMVLHEAEDPEQACLALVEVANLAGGLDNVSCAVIYVDAEATARSTDEAEPR